MYTKGVFDRPILTSQRDDDYINQTCGTLTVALTKTPAEKRFLGHTNKSVMNKHVGRTWYPSLTDSILELNKSFRGLS